jgi:uncharacterized repeat protein (TIGR02543 family)
MYYQYCFPWYYYGEYDNEAEHAYIGSSPMNPLTDTLYYRAVNLRSGIVSDMQTYSGGVSVKGIDAYYPVGTANETRIVTIDIAVDALINPVMNVTVEYFIPTGFSLTEIDGNSLPVPITGNDSWVDLGTSMTLDGDPAPQSMTLTIVSDGTASVGSCPYRIAFSVGGASIGGGGGVLYVYGSSTVDITYHSNDGQSLSQVDTVTYGTDQSVRGSGTWLRNGFEFDGWNTAADGSGTAYAQGDTLPITIYDVELYAQWAPVYEVLYESNGGSTAPVDSTLYREGALVTIPSDTLTLFDYTVSGWFYNGVYYFAGDTVAMASGGMTLAAQWQRDVYSVVYAPGTQGTWSASGETYTGLRYNDSVPVFGAQTGASTALSHASGYRFDGWSATPAVTIPSIPGGDTLTYVAQWRAVPYTITYALNNGTAAIIANAVWGSAISLPAAPTRAGYTFNGWRLTDNGAGTGNGATITGSEIFKALAANDSVGGITISADWIVNTGTSTTTNNQPASPSTPASLSRSSSSASSRTSDVSNASDASLDPASSEDADSVLDSGSSDVSSKSKTSESSDASSNSSAATEIEDSDAPLAAPGAHWALMNLILAVLGCVITSITLIAGRSRNRGTAVGNGRGQGSKRGVWHILSVAAAVAAIVVFILTQSFAGLMVWVDWMTIAYAVIVIAQVAFFALVSLRKNVMDQVGMSEV